MRLNESRLLGEVLSYHSKQLPSPSGDQRRIVRPHSHLLLVVMGPPLSLEASAAHTSWSIVMTAVVQLVQLGLITTECVGNETVASPAT